MERYGRGSWAVVTGATDGIGKAIAMDLASRGFNIVLISRTLSKLNSVAEEIQAIQFEGKNTQTRVIANDFSKDFTAKVFEDMYRDKMADLDISILANNVGMFGNSPACFA